MSLVDFCTEIGRKRLLEEWHVQKNGGLTPNDVCKTSRIVVWWKCPECGYEWQTQVASRAMGRTGCPECYRRRQEAKKKTASKR